MGRPKKNEFEDLDSDFKTSIESATDEEIRKKIAQVALNEHENRANKGKDEDLKNAKDKAKEAGRQYAEATAANKARISYAHFILESRGKV